MKAALSPAYLPPYLGKKVNAVVLAKTYTQLENAKVELDAPFSKADELAEKEAGLNELNILLNMDQKDRCLMDDTPDEGAERTAQKQGLRKITPRLAAHSVLCQYIDSL